MSRRTQNGAVPPAGGEETPGNQLSLSIQSREEITTQQVGILLNIVHTMRGLVMQEPREHGEAHQLDRENHLAASSTLIRACQRLDDIIDGKDRWDLKTHSDVNKAILSVHKRQEELLQANLDLVRMHQRPSIQLKPQIATYGDQYFIAFFGQLERPGMAIVGRGPTPHEALLDFDRAFHLVPREQFRIISENQNNPLSDEQKS